MLENRGKACVFCGTIKLTESTLHIYMYMTVASALDKVLHYIYFTTNNPRPYRQGKKGTKKSTFI